MPATVEEALSELTSLSARMKRRDTAQARDRDARRELFVYLRNNGVRQSTIARAAGVTDMAVKFAIDEAEKVSP